MKSTSLRYKTYQALLEVDLTSAQRQSLIEAGIIDKVLDFFGAGKDALTKYGGGLKKMFSDSKYARRSATAKKNIEKELKDLKSVAKDAGQDESVVYQILNMILADAGVDPKVVGNPPTADGSDGGGQPAASTGLPSGTPIKLDSKNATTTFAKINANVTGEDPKKVADDAMTQKMSPEKMSVLTMKNIAKQTGVKYDAVDAVFKALIDSGHLVAEGKLPLTRSSLLRMCKEVQVLEEQCLFAERWQYLAGLNESLLVEREMGPGAQKYYEEILGRIESGKIKSAKELKTAMTQLSSTSPKKLTSAAKKSLSDALSKKTKMPSQEAEKAVDAAATATQDASAGKDDAAAGKKGAVAAAKKKYAAAFDDVKKKVADKADDDTIGKVLTYLDDLESVEIK